MGGDKWAGLDLGVAWKNLSWPGPISLGGRGQKSGWAGKVGRRSQLGVTTFKGLPKRMEFSVVRWAGSRKAGIERGRPGRFRYLRSRSWGAVGSARIEGVLRGRRSGRMYSPAS